MKALGFELVSHAELASVSAVFSAGRQVVLGTERDGTHTLVSLAAGLSPPRVGRVQLNGAAPFSNARLRRNIGALCAPESLPPARTISRALALALRARGDAQSVSGVLGAAGLTRFAERPCAELSGRETRAVALALALSHPRPSLLALHDPLSLAPLVAQSFILDTLHDAAENGVIVLVTASRLEDADHLGGAAGALQRGIWLRSVGARTPALDVTLRVQTPDARRLADLLTNTADIQSVTWVGSQELLVRGSSLERLAEHVVKRARADAIHISALRQEPPSLDTLSAAHVLADPPAALGRPE